MTAAAADPDEPRETAGSGVAGGEDQGGVRVTQVRAGKKASRRTGSKNELVLFLIPGLDGDPDELRLVVEAMSGRQRVCVLTPEPTDSGGRAVDTVERMAELMVATVRRITPGGPYRLAGYSFGAMVAYEMGQQFHAAGEVVESLFLVDAVFDQRFWPRRTWLRALVGRSGRHLGRLAIESREHPARSARELGTRGRRLAAQVVRRTGDDERPLNALPVGGDEETLAEDSPGRRARLAMAGYRPRPYPGRVVLINGAHDRYFGCDTTELWRGLVAELDIERVGGDHLTMVAQPGPAAEVAEIIDYGLMVRAVNWSGLRPAPGFSRPLILTTMRWFSAARLAHALMEAGFVVSACRPGRHAFDAVDGLASDTRLSWFWPQRSVLQAIRRAQPDIVVCDDERSLALLRRLHTRVTGDQQLSDLLARSLGNPEDWPLIRSRTGQAALAGALGLPVASTEVVTDVDDVRRWAGRHSYPLVLKTDGSWGGRGVAIVEDEERLAQVFQALSTPPGPARSLARAMTDYTALPARFQRVRPAVNVQEFRTGREAIATAVCLDGKLLQIVCLEVLVATESHGPADAVRIVDHPGMVETARQVICRLGLTGFCGFDFLVDGDRAELIEINPRITPTCHLLVESGYALDQTLELFPPADEAWTMADRSVTPTLNVPRRAPRLVGYGERMVARRNRPTARLVRQVKRRTRREL